MVALFRLGRKLCVGLTGLAVLLALAACGPLTVGGGPLIDSRNAVPVALLVPQTAEEGAVLSQSFEKAARLAAADLGQVQIDLRVYDTGGTPAQAAAAADKAVSEGAKIILGPVFADAANAAGNAVADDGVNVLAFSNNPAVAGGNVFILGTTFQDTANRLMGYAAGQGIASLTIVHAQSPAEELGRDAILRAAARNGIVVNDAASFPLNQQGLIDAVPGIAERIANSTSQAVFLTSGNDGALPFLAQLLPENGLDPAETRVIGLQRLDIPATALSLPGLQGAWFALPDPQLSAQFRSRYAAAYGGPPHPLAGLAYDGVAAIGALVAGGRADALTAQSLTRSPGFAGVNGAFRLRPDGTNERGLAVAQIQNKQINFLDPAPRSFGGFGF